MWKGGVFVAEPSRGETDRHGDDSRAGDAAAGDDGGEKAEGGGLPLMRDVENASEMPPESSVGEAILDVLSEAAVRPTLPSTYATEVPDAIRSSFTASASTSSSSAVSLELAESSA